MASVKQAWITRYGEGEGLRMWEIQKKKYGKTHDELRTKHGNDYVESLAKKKNTFSLKGCIAKYGKVDGAVKWNDRLKTKLKTQSVNFKNKKWNNGRTLESYQLRYGVADGYSRWDKRNKHQSYMASTQRYLDEFGEDGYDIIRKIKDNTSLEAYQIQYGDVDGLVHYNKHVELMKNASKRCIDYWLTYHNGDIELATQSLSEYQNNTSLSSFTKRYGKEVGLVKYLKWVEVVTKYGYKSYSKISQTFCWNLYDSLNLSINDTQFYELNNEQSFYFGNKLIKVDFKYKQKIIEFNGDYWHANPNLYSESDMIKEYTASEIWHRDSNRIDLLEKAGYDVLVVWESEYNANGSDIINKCKKFLENE